MSKVDLQDLTSLTNEISAIGKINYNNTVLEVALEGTLSRTGTVPNEMESHLDMNNNRIYNLPQPTTATEPARLEDLEEAAGDGLTITHITVSEDTIIDPALKVDGKGLFWDDGTDKFIYSWASPKNATADLRDFLDITHGVGTWTNWTGNAASVTTGGTSIHTAGNAALNAIKDRYARGTLLIPPGNWRLDESFDTMALSGNFVQGMGDPLSTQIIYAAGSGVAWNFSGTGARTGGGLRNLTLEMEGGHPLSGVYMISCTTDAIDACSKATFEQLYIQSLGNSRMDRAINMDGVLKIVGPPDVAQGIRDLTLKDIQIFGCHSRAMYFSNCVHLKIDGVVTVGTTPTSDVYFAGGGNPATNNSTYIFINGLTCNGNIIFRDCHNFFVNAVCNNVAADVSATDGAGFIKASAVLGTLGTNTANVHIF